MMIKLISVFLENKPGRLLYLLRVLSDAQVNLQALSLADTADFGIARIIVDDLEGALRAIQEHGMTAITTEVLRVEVPDVPGGLANNIIAPLAQAEVNIEYSYGYSTHTAGKAVVVLKVDNLDKAMRALSLEG